MAEEIDVGMKCIKYMLFVSNFMFVMIGFLLVSIGTTIKAIYGDFELFMEDHYFSPATLAVAIGVIIFFVALFGCVGALKESTLLINIFSFLMVIVLILEVAAAISAYAMRSDIDVTIRRNMYANIKEYDTSYYEKKIWDLTQKRLHCCGIEGPTNWENVFPPSSEPSLNDTTGGTTETSREEWFGPKSCCRGLEGEDMTCYKDKDNLYKDGCLDALTYIVSECALLLGCGALAVAFIQILGIVFANMLAKAVRRLKTQQVVERDQQRQRVYEQMGTITMEKEKSTPVVYTSHTVEHSEA